MSWNENEIFFFEKSNSNLTTEEEKYFDGNLFDSFDDDDDDDNDEKGQSYKFKFSPKKENFFLFIDSYQMWIFFHVNINFFRDRLIIKDLIVIVDDDDDDDDKLYSNL